MANQDSQYPSVHALCSGVCEEITSPKIARAPEIALSAVTTTGVRIPLGRFMVGKQNMSNNVRQNVALLTRLVAPHLKRFRLAVNRLAQSRARRQGDTGQSIMISQGVLGASHHRCHILRKAASILRAKVPPSHNGDASRSGRKERRMSSKRSGLPASARAISTYSSTELAIKSVRPIWLSRLAPTRAAWRSPRSITTGTPIHSASQVVVVPLLGNGSSAISTRW